MVSRSRQLPSVPTQFSTVVGLAGSLELGLEEMMARV
jgi:hypothetical protein